MGQGCYKANIKYEDINIDTEEFVDEYEDIGILTDKGMYLRRFALLIKDNRLEIYKDKLKDITLEINTLKKPPMVSFLGKFIRWFARLFIWWPTIVLLSIFAFGMVWIVIGLLLALIFNVDIISNSSNVADFIGSIISPQDNFFFWPLMTWKYSWITLFIVISISVITKIINMQQIKEFQEKINILDGEEKKINKKLNEGLKIFAKRKEEKKIKQVYENKREEEEKLSLEKREQEQEQKKQKTFEKSQIAKGLIKYQENWLDSHTYKKETRIDNFLDKCRRENKYKGLFIGCNSCGYVWKIKKDYSLPLRCTACGSESLKLDREKIWSYII